MQNKFIDSEWKLVMDSKFSLSPRKKRKFRSYVDSSDEEDINNNYSTINEEKHCASCSVKKTPLWRDAEDGTPLCNACGIRYKKYKLRCGTCWHIPKKDEFHPTCQYCGSFYEYVYPRR
ncbi:GATA-type zinc finger protein 1 [Trichonephila inaurata madagascariensis]|nr:GATA-type zinc finger protein 1 [Trichonephila inaurata madagascariensis]